MPSDRQRYHAYTYNVRGRLAKVSYGTRSNAYVLKAWVNASARLATVSALAPTVMSTTRKATCSENGRY